MPEGSEGVKVNAPIAVLLAEGEKPGDVNIPAAMKDIGAAVKAEAPKKAETPNAEAPPKAETKAEAPKAEALAPGERVFASPLARRIAAEKGVDIAALSGSGPRGRIVKADVENAKPGARPAPAAGAPKGEAAGIGVAALPDARLFYKAGEYEEIPHDSMRKAIARRLTSAKTLIPHYYLSIECRLDALMATRARLNEAAGKNAAYKLSVNDFVIKASAMALMKHPDVNASWTDSAILRHARCRMSASPWPWISA